MGGIFGGAPKPVANQTVTNNPPAYAIPLLTDIANRGKSAYEQFLSSGYNQPYAGQRSAGQNPFDTQSMDIARGGADQFLAAGSPQNSLDLSKYYSDKIFGGAYDPTQAIEAYARPITQQFTESIAPRLTSAAIDAGAYGGSKAQEFNNRAVRDTNQVLADTASRTALDYGAAERQAAGMVPSLANMGLQQSGAAADVYGNIGNTTRGFEQQGINDEIARWNELTSSPFAGLGEYLGLVSGASGKYGSQTTPVMSQGGSTFGSILGQGLGGGLGGGFSALGSAIPAMFQSGGMLGPAASFIGPSAVPAGASALASLFGFLSDKRLKENILFERLEKGHRLYSFNYLWDKTRYLGVLAQEILEYLPEAVSKLGDILVVNYALLGIKMEKLHADAN